MDSHFVFDADYLARMRAKDERTLNHFYEYFYLPVRNRVRHIFGLQEADDLVQEVFLVVLSRIDAGEPRQPSKLPGYVFGICRNLTLQEFSRLKRAPVLVDDEDLAGFVDFRASIESRLVRDLNSRTVQKTQTELSDRYREVLHREFVLCQDRPTAAREMGESQDNYRLILCRALKSFRKEWEKHSPENAYLKERCEKELTHHD